MPLIQSQGRFYGPGVLVTPHCLPENGVWCVVVRGHVVHVGSLTQCRRRVCRIFSKQKR